MTNSKNGVLLMSLESIRFGHNSVETDMLAVNKH